MFFLKQSLLVFGSDVADSGVCLAADASGSDGCLPKEGADA